MDQSTPAGDNGGESRKQGFNENANVTQPTYKRRPNELASYTSSKEIVVEKAFAIIVIWEGTDRQTVQKEIEMAKLTQEMAMIKIELKRTP